MKHVFYVSLFLLCFNILHSENIQTLNLKDVNNIKDLKTYKNILDRKLGGDNQRLHGLSQKPQRRHDDTSESIEISSSEERMKWKDEWSQYWVQKKLEALNSTPSGGDRVNMVAARPWGVSCGDPDQHGISWGSCMLPMECEAEYRIYRGDYFCGRTNFICCAIQLTNYDLYGGFDVSFEDSNFETDSEEKNFENNIRGLKDRKRKRRERERRRRRRERAERKSRIRKVIKRIVREIRKILIRSFRNGTLQRKKKTRELKDFIKMLKKKYMHDRRIVRDIHEAELIKIDDNLLKRLKELRDVNEHMAKNQTYRDIILNGTINRNTLRTLMKEYPELEDMVQDGRRNAGPTREYLEYDIEYGYLYD